ncbi:hypothetical protein BHM03_00058713 [Ensete ventricosum]|nr:hypothetical protein BHM03_00058713 [Ensete ventricosum]
MPTEEPKFEDTTLEPKEKDAPQSATRTVPILLGYTNLQILKIERFLEQQSIIVLINTGSTHNFMSSKLSDPTMLNWPKLLLAVARPNCFLQPQKVKDKRIA